MGVSGKDELEPVLERMRRDWDERAARDAECFVYSRDLSADESDFEASGRLNYEQLVRPFLPVLLRGRSPKSCRLLEIGCGVGRMTRWFAQEFQEVHGVDISADMVRLARARLRDCPNVVLHVGSGMDLAGLPDRYFDLAFSYIVFQHIPSRAVIENYLRETARVLKPGGAFKFQLNGYTAPEYQRREKDTWLGESFSFVEAIRMLRKAGFSPLSATGAGTQYFVLTARKSQEEARPLASYIFPGEGWAEEQFLEGWKRPIPGDCRPIAPRCRTRLGVPCGPALRFFLSLYFAPAEPFPALTLAVWMDGVALATVIIGRAGDHYFDWPVPGGIAQGRQATVTLEFHPADETLAAGVRCLGFYVPRTEADQALEGARLPLS